MPGPEPTESAPALTPPGRVGDEKPDNQANEIPRLVDHLEAGANEARPGPPRPPAAPKPVGGPAGGFGGGSVGEAAGGIAEAGGAGEAIAGLAELL
jgi:hypothetical protein